MRSRRALTVVVVAAAAAAAGCVLVVACSSFDGGPSDASPADGAADAPIDTARVDAPIVSDAGPDAPPGDAAPDGACKGGKDGRPVVRVGPFCMDVTEVSVEQYTAFVAASPAKPDGGPLCLDNDIHVPVGCGGSTASDSPQTCVDWCDAAAYCRWAGKHLCGAIDGGALIVADNDKPKRDAWYRACAGEDGGRTYAFGGTYDGGTCQTEATMLADIGTKPGCVTPEGVLDLTGNAREWIDSCDDPVGTGCIHRGGSYQSSTTAKCAGATLVARTATAVDVGFRCCSD